MSRAEPVLFPFFFSRFAFLFSFTDLAGFFLVSFLVFLDFAINILLNRKSERIPHPAKAGLRERLNNHLRSRWLC